MLPYVTVHTDTAHAYGACLIVCANTETVRDRLGLGLDPAMNDAADAAVRAAAVVCAGLDYHRERNFCAYNGGPLKSLIEARYAVADIDEDGEPGPWRAADADTVPADVRAAVDAVIDQAYREAEVAAREWASREWAEQVIERAARKREDR
jgi:hypothetical protein